MGRHVVGMGWRWHGDGIGWEGRSGMGWDGRGGERWDGMGWDGGEGIGMRMKM